MSRAFDLIAVFAVAVVLLLPKASLDARPALEGDRVELDRVAELEDALYRAPDDVDRAVALADAYLRLGHPDWTLATLARFADRGAYKVHLLAATARAERLEAELCLAEKEKGMKACDAAGPACPEADRVRLGVIASAMGALVEGGIDPKKDPVRARQAVAKILKATKAPAR
jgi:hypothetical protein